MFQLAQVNIELLFICFLYCAKEGIVVENIETEVATWKIVSIMQRCKKMQE